MRVRALRCSGLTRILAGRSTLDFSQLFVTNPITLKIWLKSAHVDEVGSGEGRREGLIKHFCIE